MINKFRFWLSFQLLMLGVKAAPSEFVQKWIKHGLRVAGRGIEKDLLKDNKMESNNEYL